MSSKKITYSSEYKLKVLDYYFKHGGDEKFGLKKKTASHFNIDKKTINRMLNNPDMVKRARKLLAARKGSGSTKAASSGPRQPVKPVVKKAGGTTNKLSTTATKSASSSQPSASSSSSSNKASTSTSSSTKTVGSNSRQQVNSATNNSNKTTPTKSKPGGMEDKGSPGVEVYELPEDPDYSLLKQSINAASNGVASLAKLLVTGTEEVRTVVLNECDVILECKVCRNLFRSVVNFLAHKRIYCQEEFADVRTLFHKGDVQGVTSQSNTIVVEPEPPPEDENFNPLRTAIPTTHISPMKPIAAQGRSRRSGIDSIALKLARKRKAYHASSSTHVGSSSYYQSLSEVSRSRDKLSRDCSVVLEDIGVANAVFQTYVPPGAASPSTSMSCMVDEAANSKSGITVAINQNGDIVKTAAGDITSMDVDQPSSSSESRDLTCLLCNTSFATQKTLSVHQRSHHGYERCIYYCPICQASFLSMWAVVKHLQRTHKKTKNQIERLRKVVRKNVRKKMTYQNTDKDKTNAEASKEVEEEEEEEEESNESSTKTSGLVSPKKSEVVVKSEVSIPVPTTPVKTSTHKGWRSKDGVRWMCNVCRKMFITRVASLAHVATHIVCNFEPKAVLVNIQNDKAVPESRHSSNIGNLARQKSSKVEDSEDNKKEEEEEDEADSERDSESESESSPSSKESEESRKIVTQETVSKLKKKYMKIAVSSSKTNEPGVGKCLKKKGRYSDPGTNITSLKGGKVLVKNVCSNIKRNEKEKRKTSSDLGGCKSTSNLLGRENTTDKLVPVEKISKKTVTVVIKSKTKGAGEEDLNPSQSNAYSVESAGVRLSAEKSENILSKNEISTSVSNPPKEVANKSVNIQDRVVSSDVQFDNETDRAPTPPDKKTAVINLKMQPCVPLLKKSQFKLQSEKSFSESQSDDGAHKTFINCCVNGKDQSANTTPSSETQNTGGVVPAMATGVRSDQEDLDDVDDKSITDSDALTCKRNASDAAVSDKDKAKSPFPLEVEKPQKDSLSMDLKNVVENIKEEIIDVSFIKSESVDDLDSVNKEKIDNCEVKPPEISQESVQIKEETEYISVKAEEIDDYARSNHVENNDVPWAGEQKSVLSSISKTASFSSQVSNVSSSYENPTEIRTHSKSGTSITPAPKILQSDFIASPSSKDPAEVRATFKPKIAVTTPCSAYSKDPAEVRSTFKPKISVTPSSSVSTSSKDSAEARATFQSKISESPSVCTSSKDSDEIKATFKPKISVTQSTSSSTSSKDPAESRATFKPKISVIPSSTSSSKDPAETRATFKPKISVIPSSSTSTSSKDAGEARATFKPKISVTPPSAFTSSKNPVEARATFKPKISVTPSSASTASKDPAEARAAFKPKISVTPSSSICTSSKDPAEARAAFKPKISVTTTSKTPLSEYGIPTSSKDPPEARAVVKPNISATPSSSSSKIPISEYSASSSSKDSAEARNTKSRITVWPFVSKTPLSEHSVSTSKDSAEAQANLKSKVSVMPSKVSPISQDLSKAKSQSYPNLTKITESPSVQKAPIKSSLMAKTSNVQKTIANQPKSSPSIVGTSSKGGASSVTSKILLKSKSVNSGVVSRTPECFVTQKKAISNFPVTKTSDVSTTSAHHQQQSMPSTALLKTVASLSDSKTYPHSTVVPKGSSTYAAQLKKYAGSSLPSPGSSSITSSLTLTNPVTSEKKNVQIKKDTRDHILLAFQKPGVPVSLPRKSVDSQASSVQKAVSQSSSSKSEPIDPLIVAFRMTGTTVPLQASAQKNTANPSTVLVKKFLNIAATSANNESTELHAVKSKPDTVTAQTPVASAIAFSKNTGTCQSLQVSADGVNNKQVSLSLAQPKPPETFPVKFEAAETSTTQAITGCQTVCKTVKSSASGSENTDIYRQPMLCESSMSHSPTDHTSYIVKTNEGSSWPKSANLPENQPKSHNTSMAVIPHVQSMIDNSNKTVSSVASCSSSVHSSTAASQEPKKSVPVSFSVKGNANLCIPNHSPSYPVHCKKSENVMEPKISTHATEPVTFSFKSHDIAKTESAIGQSSVVAAIGKVTSDQKSRNLLVERPGMRSNDVVSTSVCSAKSSEDQSKVIQKSEGDGVESFSIENKDMKEIKKGRSDMIREVIESNNEKDLDKKHVHISKASRIFCESGGPSGSDTKRSDKGIISSSLAVNKEALYSCKVDSLNPSTKLQCDSTGKPENDDKYCKKPGVETYRRYKSSFEFAGAVKPVEKGSRITTESTLLVSSSDSISQPPNFDAAVENTSSEPKAEHVNITKLDKKEEKSYVKWANVDKDKLIMETIEDDIKKANNGKSSDRKIEVQNRSSVNVSSATGSSSVHDIVDQSHSKHKSNEQRNPSLYKSESEPSFKIPSKKIVNKEVWKMVVNAQTSSSVSKSKDSCSSSVSKDTTDDLSSDLTQNREKCTVKLSGAKLQSRTEGPEKVKSSSTTYHLQYSMKRKLDANESETSKRMKMTSASSSVGYSVHKEKIKLPMQELTERHTSNNPGVGDGGQGPSAPKALSEPTKERRSESPFLLQAVNTSPKNTHSQLDPMMADEDSPGTTLDETAVIQSHATFGDLSYDYDLH